MESETLKEELKTRGEELLDWIITTIKEGEALVRDETPKFVHEVIAYGRVTETMDVVIAMSLFLAGAIYWTTYATTHIRRLERNETEGVPEVPCLIIFSLAGLVGFFVSLHEWSEAVKVWVAPRLYLLERVGNLF